VIKIPTRFAPTIQLKQRLLFFTTLVQHFPCKPVLFDLIC